jgi:hypothetical protein
MRYRLIDALVVLSYSTGTQWALLVGMLSFVGLMLAGEYFAGGLQFEAALAPLTEIVREHLVRRYDAAGSSALGGCLLVAAKRYRKGRKRLVAL